MNGKQTLFVTICLTLMAISAFGAVTVTDTGDRKEAVRGHNYSRVDRAISFNNNGQVPYVLRYVYINDPAYKTENPKAVLPWIGDPTAGTAGLGMSQPWYSRGFLGIEINGKLLTGTLAKEFKIVEQGKRGICDVVWSPEWADIRARFASMPDDDKLYVEVSINPKVQVSSLKLRFACMPGQGLPKRDQWISTAERSVQHGPAPIVLDTKKEPWVFYYDTQNTPTGACALLYAPEEVSGATVNISANATAYTFLSYPASARKMRFVLYSFPTKYKSRDEAFLFLKENGSNIFESLKKFDFGS